MSIQSPLPRGGIEVIAILSIFHLFAVLAIVARFHSRLLQRKAFSLDDYLIAASLVFTTATAGVGYALVLNGGVGLHTKDATQEQIAVTLKLFLAARFSWVTSTCLMKLSILLFYISVFTVPRIRTAVFIIIGLTVTMFVAVLLEVFLTCRPFEFTWDKTIPGGVCGNSTYGYLVIAIVNMVIDFSVTSLPMPVLWKLKMPARKKLAISAILGLGFVICGLSAARIKSVLALNPHDFTYSVVPDLIFGGLEVELGTVNACLPLLRPLARKVFSADSVFFKGWSSSSKKAEMNSDRTDEPLSDNTMVYPLSDVGVGVGVSADEMGDQALEERVEPVDYTKDEMGRRQGHILVKKDFYLYQTSADLGTKDKR